MTRAWQADARRTPRATASAEMLSGAGSGLTGVASGGAVSRVSPRPPSLGGALSLHPGLSFRPRCLDHGRQTEAARRAEPASREHGRQQYFISLSGQGPLPWGEAHMYDHAPTSAGRGTKRRIAPALSGILGGAAALVLVSPLSASAHVSMSADTTAAGSTAVLALNVGHGCEESPTTRIAVKIPAGINEVKPTVNPGWTVTKRDAKLAQPITDDAGNSITSRVDQVIWTAKTPLPDGYRDVLSLQLTIPEDAVDQQLSFPTVQTCTEGETGWIQIPAAGQDHDELENPAPTITVTAAEGEDHHAAGSAAEASPEPEAAAPEAAADLQASSVSSASLVASGAGLAGLVMGALGLVAGGTALARTRASRTTPDRR
jgi:uncharacterized protein YcnI